MNWRSMEIMLSNGQNKQQGFTFILSTFEKGSASNYCTWIADCPKTISHPLPSYGLISGSKKQGCYLPTSGYSHDIFFYLQLFEIQWIKSFSVCLDTEEKQSKSPPAPSYGIRQAKESEETQDFCSRVHRRLTLKPKPGQFTTLFCQLCLLKIFFQSQKAGLAEQPIRGNQTQVIVANSILYDLARIECCISDQKTNFKNIL